MMIFFIGLEKKKRKDLNNLAPDMDFCGANFFGHLLKKGSLITRKTRKYVMRVKINSLVV